MAGPLTLTALLDAHVRERAEATALIEGGRTYSWRELDELVRRTAAWLEAQGVGGGDYVAVWLVNRVEWLALFFGLARVGAAMVAVNTRYRSGELEHILAGSGARLLVLQLGFRKIDFPEVLAGVDPARVPALERVAVVGAEASLPERLMDRPVLSFDAFKTCAPMAADHADPESPAILFTTSGTTSGPKMVLHPQRTLAWHARSAAAAYGLSEPDACLLAALPYCGVFGFVAMLAAVAGGAPLVAQEAFDAEEALALIREHRVTHAFGSDEMFRRIMDLLPEGDPLPWVRVFGFASFGPGLTDLARAGEARALPLLGLYGSSEVQALFSLNRADMPVAERVQGGGYPAAGDAAEIRIRDVETGELLPVGESGEIEIRAPGNFSGYLNNPEATAKAVTADGFFRTGDVGRLRGDGSFVYETRGGDAIRLGGYLVSPGEIEEVIKSQPGVDGVQVVAVDIDGQPRAVAFVIPEPGATLDAEQLTAATVQVLARFKVPARVWFVDEFPVTLSPNGTKIQRNRLRQMALERLAGE